MALARKKVGRDVMSFTGRWEVTLNVDGEPSIAVLADAIKALSGLEMGVEVSPVGLSKANGEVERAFRTAPGQARALKSASDANYGKDFG